MRSFRAPARAALAAGALVAASLGMSLGAAPAGAQALGPQRQFLAVEPYYEYTRLDVGMNDASATANISGVGGRLWINGAPFHFPRNSAIALFMTYAPSRSQSAPQQFPAKPITSGFSLLQYGAQVDQFFVRRPLGGVLDPFVSLGVGTFRYRFDESIPIVGGTTETHLSLSPGFGVRIPIPNRLELRGDVRDMFLINGRTNTDGSQQTTSNVVIQGGLGLTF